MPEDFPSHYYDAIIAIAGTLDAAYRNKHNGEASSEWMAFTAAANGMMYRWRALSEADETLAKTISEPPPGMEGRYVEEAALFAFFTNGLSVIEVMYFAMYAFAAQLQPSLFDQLSKDQKKLTPSFVSDAFAKHFSNEVLSSNLADFLHDGLYMAFKDTRNILSHRGAPPRHFAYAPPSLPGGNGFRPSATWSGFTLDENLAPDLRSKLSTRVSRLLEVCNAFAQRQVATLL